MDHRTMNLTDMIDNTIEIPYNLHIFAGFLVGVFSSAITSHLDDLLLTFFLGAMSALGAGLVKFLLTWLKRLSMRDKSITKREEDQKIKDDKEEAKNK